MILLLKAKEVDMVANLDQVIPIFVIVPFVVLFICMILALFKQPYVVAYILAGLVISQLGIVPKQFQLGLLGEIGIILLMFFIGMEVSLPKLISKWKVALTGPLLQIILSVIVVFILGNIFDWPWQRSVLIGFIITLSSSAVIIKILDDLGELHTKVGQNVLGILIVQDIIVVPLMIIISFMSGEKASSIEIFLQIIGALILGTLMYLVITRRLAIPIPKGMVENHELQVFTALAICFGLAALSSFFGLSAPLGAFFAGIVVTSFRGTDWVHQSLHGFKVVFVAMFFIYVGTLLDLTFLRNNLLIVVSLVLVVFVINTLINTMILYLLGSKIKESFYAASLLAQIGEFSFLLGAVGVAAGLIFEFEYNLIIAVISLSLLLSPLWIHLTKKIMNLNANYIFEEVSKKVQEQFELTSSLDPDTKRKTFKRKIAAKQTFPRR